MILLSQRTFAIEEPRLGDVEFELVAVYLKSAVK